MPIGKKCVQCGSDRERGFNGEIAIHFPGLKGLEKPIVWVFPKVFVCADCGMAKFQVPQTELRVLGEADTVAAGLTACPVSSAYQVKQPRS